MEYIVLLLVLASTFIGWIFSLNDKAGNYKGLIGGFICVVIPFMIVEIFISYNKANNPTALDVYRGKTTLEITYRDNIPVDSVVVFKAGKL